jgi:two-component system, NarL family, nitrate/nitrite response regulator NarL
MSNRVRVGIVDAHPLFRAGVGQLLTLSHDCEVVAEGATAEDAFRIARQDAPDVLVVDLHSEFNVETVARLAGEFSAMRTMILTVIADENQVVSALRAGVAGYMLKGASGAELIESIRRVHKGESYVYPSLAARLIGLAVNRQSTPDRFSTLTTREEQILDYLTRGLSNKEIGHELTLSGKTIKYYVTSLLEKLDARNRVEAALLGQGRVLAAAARR